MRKALLLFLILIVVGTIAMAIHIYSLIRHGCESRFEKLIVSDLGPSGAENNSLLAEEISTCCEDVTFQYIYDCPAILFFSECNGQAGFTTRNYAALSASCKILGEKINMVIAGAETTRRLKSCIDDSVASYKSALETEVRFRSAKYKLIEGLRDSAELCCSEIKKEFLALCPSGDLLCYGKYEHERIVKEKYHESACKGYMEFEEIVNRTGSTAMANALLREILAESGYQEDTAEFDKALASGLDIAIECVGPVYKYSFDKCNNDRKCIEEMKSDTDTQALIKETFSNSIRCKMLWKWLRTRK